MLIDSHCHLDWKSFNTDIDEVIKRAKENGLIAIIYPESKVPKVWRDIVEKTYPKSAVPWEAEAKWAGLTEGMTEQALKACATGKMWEVYKPTPLTEKWLREEGYIE